MPSPVLPQCRCFEMDQYSSFHLTNLYYPFANLDDWEMANFLLQSKLSMAKIDEYLSLKMVHPSQQFCPCHALIVFCYLTASQPRNCETELNYLQLGHAGITGLSIHPTPRRFQPFYHMIYTLFRVFTPAERVVREFSEWMSRDIAWQMQSNLPAGAMLCSIVLSSDKTHITNMCGGKVVHPLLISLANIKMAMQNKASSHAFLLTALIPVIEFIHPMPRMHSVLEAHLFHQCLDIILQPLKIAVQVGRMMSDPVGGLHHCFTPLAAYIVNTPEACMLVCVHGKTSPVTMASHKHFEPLHHWYQKFWDHNVQWCKNALGAQELNFCYSVLHPIVSMRHFNHGIMTLKQVTGQAQRDMQHYMIAVIGGAASQDVVIAVHAPMDSQYLAQAPRITSIMQENISTALLEFHNHKDAITSEGFVAPSISELGVPVQWSADTTEHAHIEVVKEPASTTNNQNYDAQICHYLDRVERCQLFETAIRLCTLNGTNDACDHNVLDSPVEDSGSRADETTMEDDEEDAAAVLNDIWSPRRPVPNFFTIAEQLQTALPSSVPHPTRTFTSGATALHVNYMPAIKSISIDKWCSPPDAHLPFRDLQIWYKVHLQQKSYHDSGSLGPMFTINAHPPDHTWEYGRHDAAILQVDTHHEWPSSGLVGHAVVDVHLIMCPISLKGISLVWSDCFLVYVQWFDIVPQWQASMDRTTGLHVLNQAMCASGEFLGDIFPLDQIKSYAHLVPCFGETADI
ncbi:hypothetical protein EDC04DRAFT_2613138 [Pisolithus marmoratus]|nr:hypothetical protein EDC04DRAFT_2613138 [Pisolithus marmoratus]